MHVRAVFLVVLVLCLGCRQGQSGSSSSDTRFVGGDKAPPLELTDFNSGSRSLSEFRGKVILLNFWATWCSPCIAEMPSLERLYKALKGRGLEVVAISLDPPTAKQEVLDFVKRTGLSFTVLLDPEAASPLEYGVTGFPETFFISANGELLPFADPMDGKTKLRIISDRPWDSQPYIDAVGKLLPASSVAAKDGE